MTVYNSLCQPNTSYHDTINHIYIDSNVGMSPKVVKSRSGTGIMFEQIIQGNARTSAYANSPGSYEVVARVSKTTLYKKDETVVDVFFTGYGRIEKPKLYFIVSDSIFSEPSTYTHSMRRKDGRFYWGLVTEPVSSDNDVIMELTGPPFSGDSYPTMFIDYDDESDSTQRLNWLYTEAYTKLFTPNNVEIRPPVQFDLFTKDYDAGGDYDLKFYFTYFNGNEWKTSFQEIPIHLNTWLEQYPGTTWVLGTIIALVGLIGIIPVVRAGVLFINNKYFTNKKTATITQGNTQNENIRNGLQKDNSSIKHPAAKNYKPPKKGKS